MVALDQDAQTLGVEGQHIAHAAVLGAERALVRPAGGILLARRRTHRLELDHRGVAKLAEARLGIVDIGDAARHAGSELPAGTPQPHDPAARNVFAAVIAGAFAHGDGTRVAHGKALARHALEVGLARDGAIEDRVTHDDVLQRIARAGLGLAHDHAAAPQALADIV